MSSLIKKLAAQANRISDNDDLDNEDQQEVEIEKEKKENIKPVARTIRGKAAALLAASSSSESDSDSDSGSNCGPYSKKPTSGGGGFGGIYSMKINQTKKSIKENHTQFENVDSKKSFYSKLALF
jgi:hypothetical protein